MRLEFDKIAADRLAYHCAKAIERRDIRTRSAIDDALLDYLQIGYLYGPKTVPEWMEKYESEQYQDGTDIDRG